MKLAATVIQSTESELNAFLQKERLELVPVLDGIKARAARYSISKNTFEMKVHNALYAVLRGLLYNL